MLIADTHVHLYPCYDLALALRSAAGNLSKCLREQPRNSTKLLCLTERHDCHFFKELSSQALKVAGYNIEPYASPALLHVTGSSLDLHILAGRQLVTSERLELLVLGVDAKLKDGMPLADAIKACLDLGALPVIPWSPGKWLGARGKIVSEAIERNGSNVALSDSSLRPWPITSCHLNNARRHGYRILAGSDPLPFAGEERLIGSYGIVYSAELDRKDPTATLKSIACSADRNAASEVTIVGKRSSLFEVTKRLIKLRKTA